MTRQAMVRLKNTLAAATEIDPTITPDDVEQLITTYVEQKKQAHGANSFVDNCSKTRIYDKSVFHHTCLRTNSTRQGCYVFKMF